MKFFWVKRRTLLLLAGIVWVVAGANILRIAIQCWASSSQHWAVMLLEALIIGSLFFGFVFKRLFAKNTARVESKQNDGNCPFSFFDTKGWIVMTFMIVFGVLSRSYGWLPNEFISVFYAGLSVALIITGTLFVWAFFKYRSV